MLVIFISNSLETNIDIDTFSSTDNPIVLTEVEVYDDFRG